MLGSTGSIGTQALEVCDHLGYRVLAMSANNNINLFKQQIEKFQPEYVYINPKYQSELKELFPNIDILSNEDLATKKVDIVLNALSGMQADVTKSAILAGNNVALANKESLIFDGKYIMQLAKENGVKIIPVDSEHSAIFQCLQCGKHVRKIILTASGGPFFGYTRHKLETVTREDVFKHPTWNMGRKVTVDSSTLMNKGYEVLEAMALFDLTLDQIEIVIHPESIVHSAVEFVDGSVIAQLGCPDMRLPIQYALTYPNRFESLVKPLSLTEISKLTFYKPDLETFTPLRDLLGAIPNGTYKKIIEVNEKKVEEFLNGKIDYIEIFNTRTCIGNG